METCSSLTHSQESGTGPYSEADTNLFSFNRYKSRNISAGERLFEAKFLLLPISGSGFSNFIPIFFQQWNVEIECQYRINTAVPAKPIRAEMIVPNDVSILTTHNLSIVFKRYAAWLASSN